MKKLAIIIFFTLVLVGLSGCGIVESLQEWKNGTLPQQEEATPTGEESGEPLEQSPITEENTPTLELNSETREVALFFTNATGDSLKQELRQIPKNESIARTTMEALIDGPLSAGLYPTVPVNTILDRINIKDGLCTVDFSSELTDNHIGGLIAEELTVYSIVNTLTQFPSIEQVQILVDGQILATLAGHVDVSTAISRNYELVK